MKPGARRLGWVVMVAVVVGLVAVGLLDRGGPVSPEARAQRVSESVMCPTCAGQSVADSNSSAARGIRATIDQRISEGFTDEEIRDELAGSYGDRILLTPERSGLEGLVWALPIAGFVIAVTGLFLVFRRWKGQGGAHASDADRELVEQALDELHTASTGPS
ncbi:MAG TPA: cytochrome c-type biogenesis protein [Acidimicrobiales bacterium]